MFNPHWNLITVKRGEMRPAPLHVPTPHPRPELSNQTSLSQYLLFIPTENHGETICALDSRVVIYNKIIIILLIAITCIMTRRLVGICTGHETVNTLSFVLPETKEGSGHLGCSMLTHVPRSRWGQWWLEMEAGVKIPGNDDTLPGSRDSGGEDDGAGEAECDGGGQQSSPGHVPASSPHNNTQYCRELRSCLLQFSKSLYCLLWY